MSSPGGGQVVGRVSALRAFPVKSMDAEPLAEARVLPSGLESDRGWAVVDATGEVVTAKEAGVLRTVRAVSPTSPDLGPSLLLPGQAAAVHGRQADAALSELVGRPVSLRPGSGRAFTEVAPVHLVSRQSIARAPDHAHEDEPCPCSVEEPRANLVLDLDADAAPAGLETDWVGRELHAGDVVLRVSRAPRHCLGVYADVVTAGRVVVDDAVTLV